jgi:hypothetical protein
MYGIVLTTWRIVLDVGSKKLHDCVIILEVGQKTLVE